MFSSMIPVRLSVLVCIGVRWNLLGQVGGAPGVGILGGVKLDACHTPIESCVVSHLVLSTLR
jgi:hypothetical protein